MVERRKNYAGLAICTSEESLVPFYVYSKKLHVHGHNPDLVTRHNSEEKEKHSSQFGEHCYG